MNTAFLSLAIGILLVVLGRRYSGLSWPSWALFRASNGFLYFSTMSREW